MPHPTILVSGATGKTGGAVVAELRRRGWPVRAMVRTRDARSARLEALGAETVVADVFDPDQVLDAMRGTARAYYCPPFHPHMIDSAATFAVAAREARLESIVGLTQWLASPAHPGLETRQHWLVDSLFGMLPGIGHTIVEPGFFADNYLRPMALAAHLGLFPSLTGDSRNAPPSNEDIARVAVAALMDPRSHAGRRYRPTGPTLLDTAEMAAILSQVLGRSVRRVEMPFWLFVRAALLLGARREELVGYRYWVEDHRQGAFAHGGPTEDVLAVTGRAPEDFATIARRYAALPEARRTTANALRTLATFLRAPFAPGFDPQHFARRHGFPIPPRPRFAMDDPRWQAGRGTPHAAAAA